MLKYDYPNNKINRSNHTYLDYLAAYIHENTNLFVWQLDFLGAVKSDSNNILALVMPLLQLPILKVIKNPNTENDEKEGNFPLSFFTSVILFYYS